MRWIVGLALLLCVVPAAFAEETMVMLRDGTMRKGEIVSVSENGIRLKTGTGELSLSQKKLDGLAFYVLWAQHVKDDAKGNLQLAVFCYERGYPNQSRLHYYIAKALDPKLVEKFETEILPKIRDDIAKELLKTAHRARGESNYQLAERACSMILTEFDECHAADEAGRLLSSLHMREVGESDDKRASRMEELEKKQAKEELKAERARTKVIDPLERRIRRGQEKVVSGLRTKNSGQKRNKLESAAKYFENTIKQIEKAKSTHTEDAQLTVELDELLKLAQKEGVEAWVNVGSVYIIRRDYKNSLSCAQRALAIDGDNQFARDFNQRVMVEAQWRQGWGGAGGRGGR